MRFQDYNLDKEELEISRSLDRGEWKSVPNSEQEKEKAKIAANNYFRKNPLCQICKNIFV